MVNILVYNAKSLVDKVVDRISSYQGSWRWTQDYFGGYRFCCVDPSLIKPIKVSYLYPKGRVGRDTEVDHFKAELDPTLSPIDSGGAFYFDFSQENVPRPYNPWVESTDCSGYLQPNRLHITIVEHVRGSDPWTPTSSLDVTVDHVQSPDVYLKWDMNCWSSYNRKHSQRVSQGGILRLRFSLVGAEVLGNAPPIDWIKSKIWENVNFEEVQIAEGEAWQKTFEKLMLNTNNIANVVQLADAYKSAGEAAQKGVKIWKQMSSASDARTARYYWYRLDYDVKDFSQVADARTIYGVSFNDVARQMEVDEFGKRRATLRRLGKKAISAKSEPSSLWLAWRFSFNTSKADFMEAMDFIERTGIKDSLAEAHNAQDVVKALFGENLAERSTQRAYAVVGPTEVRVTVKYKPHFSGEVYDTGTAISRLVNQVQWNIKKWGFQANPYNIWDMIPLSFMADYVYDIGGCLETLSRSDIGDYFMVERAIVTKKTVVQDVWQGVPVQLTYFSRRCPRQIPDLEISFSAKNWGSRDTSSRTKVMRLLDGISMLGGN